MAGERRAGKSRRGKIFWRVEATGASQNDLPQVRESAQDDLVPDLAGPG